MRQVGAFEAKTHLSALLDAVETGEEIVITKRGRPVARLVPPGASEAARRRDAVARIRDLRARLAAAGAGWSAEEVLAVRDEGRR